MDYYAGIDVSLEASSVCVIDGSGKIVREAKIASEPEALSLFLRSLGFEVTRIGLEAGALPGEGWGEGGFPAIPIDQGRL